MSNFKWTISALECLPKYESVQDYVITCHWRYGIDNGLEPTDKDYIYTDIFGAQSFQRGEITPDFTPYADLTEAQVIGWLEASLDVATMQVQLEQRLENIINPPIIQPPLPWQSLTAQI